ncbi:Neuronal pentraxin-1 [Liparis tanakae]|uniref:Neuronal pentraxin-1 n=1 Tax=Liparis tanakae TaxID=230148 RepID=A0A4Z2I985_9TELE|nr:Neuronal pentraxin-1 [Liparis tanakae]
MKRSPVNELFALTVCLRLKAGAGPGLGTPFSYAVPGQANELVLMEWGSNPMELLISDKVKGRNGFGRQIGKSYSHSRSLKASRHFFLTDAWVILL